MNNTGKTREDLLQTLIHHMMSLVKNIGRDFLKSEPSLSPPQVRLLFSIGSRSDGLSVTELAEITGVTPGAITQFVNGLVDKNLVAREGDPNDRRIVKLMLTEMARNEFEKLKKEHLASVTRVFEPLSNEELQQFIDILAKISASPDRKEA
jgi:DNA-binding MarR family transcriptional regulator